jgi:hypothetical protein
VVAIILATDMAKHFTKLKTFNSMIEAEGNDVNRWNDPSLALETLVHTADLSNPAKPMDRALKWADLAMAEFFAQGDRERNLAMPISQMCDRLTVTRSSAQVGFVSFMVRPMFEAYGAIGNVPMAMDNLDAFLAFNKAEAQKEKDKLEESKSEQKLQVSNGEVAIDLRKMVADFLKSKTEAPCFAIFRPCSDDAIRRMSNGQSVGKGLNVKGKVATAGELAGYIPFMQISEDRHKIDIEQSPSFGRIMVYFRREESRAAALSHLQAILDEVMKRIPMMRPEIVVENTYSPECWGLNIPEPLVSEAYIQRQELGAYVGWNSGRKSDPAFMDMIMQSIRDTSSQPQIVLYQLDDSQPMNPFGLVLAHAENTVKPVVSDLDLLTFGSKGMQFQPLPAESVRLAMWSLDRTAEIIPYRNAHSWTERWTMVLHELAETGQCVDAPDHGCGDQASVDFIRSMAEHVACSGAVRHGPECFNFHFPQELDSEFLIVWDGLGETPWKYVDQAGLRHFLMTRINEGYTFPLNPIWPIRDPGWFEIFRALCVGRYSGQSLESWYPPGSGMLRKVETMCENFPESFVQLDAEEALKTKSGKCSDLREDVELVMHQVKRKAKPEAVLRKKGSTLPASHPSVHDTMKRLKGDLEV